MAGRFSLHFHKTRSGNLFFPTRYTADFAVVRLEYKLPRFDFRINRICLPHPEFQQTPRDAQFLAVGWGHLGESKETLKLTLEKVNVEFVGPYSADCDPSFVHYRSS